MQGSNDCAMITMPSRHTDVLQLIIFPKPIPIYYLMTVIQTSLMACRYPSYTDTKKLNPLLALITIPEGCSIFTPHFVVPAIKSLTAKMSVALWGYQFDTFMILSEPLFNFKLMSDLEVTNLTKKNLILFCK